MKRTVLSILILLMVVGGVFAEGQRDDGKKTIGFTFHSSQVVFQNLIKEEFVAEAEKRGYEVRVIDPLTDIEKQNSAVETFVSLGVDAIVTSPLDFTGCVPQIKAANEAGIPIVAANCEVDPSAGDFSYVGSLNYDAGFIQGEHFAKVLPQNAKVVYLRGTEGMEHTNARREGLEDALFKKRPDVELLAEMTANYARSEGMMVMEDWIQAFPQIDGVMAANDEMALGALEALKGAGIKGVLIGGIDGNDEAKQNVKNGTFSITVLQNAKGQAVQSLEAAIKMMNGEDVPKRIIVPFEPIITENVDDYM